MDYEGDRYEKTEYIGEENIEENICGPVVEQGI
jgi:hypothetical protein